MELRLHELIDLDPLQELSDGLYAATGMASSIIDPAGQVLVGSGWQRICTDFHRTHPRTSKKCRCAAPPGHKKLGEHGPFAIHRCPLGLVGACAPLVIEGEHLANLFTGQLFLAPPDAALERAFRKQAKRYGFEEDEYLAAFREVPVFSEETFQAGLGLLAKLGKTIEVMGASRLQEATKQERARDALQRSEEHYRSLFKNMAEGFAYCQMLFEDGRPADFVYLDVNEAFQNLTGLTGVVGKKVTEVIPGIRELHPELFELYGRVSETGVPERFEIYFEPLESWLAISAYSIEKGFFFAVFDDVTQRKRTNDALSESSEFCRQIIDNAGEGIIVYGPDTRYQLWNPWMEQLSGLRTEEVIGKLPDEVFPFLRNVGWRERLDKALAGERPAPLDVPFHVPETGRSGWASQTMGPLRNAKGEIVGAIATIRDITEQRRAEEERSQMIALLKLLNSTTGKDELISELLLFLKDWSQCEAVGIRLQNGEDYPYYVHSGFSGPFIAAESSLCAHHDSGVIMRDERGDAVLECMCGNIIRGRFDPSLPFFTSQGSFWTNSTSELLATTTEAERQANTRNRCNQAGFEAVALIPLRVGREALGLLQFNDRRKGAFTAEMLNLGERMAASIASYLANRLVEEELARSRERFRALYEYSSVPIWEEDFSGVKARFDKLRAQGITDFREYLENHQDEVVRCAELVKVLDVNQESLRFFEVNRKEALITHLASYFCDDSWEPVREEMTALAEGATRYNCEIPIQMLDGQRRILALHLSVVPGYEDTLERVMVSFWDITDRKRAEQEKDKLHAQLLQAQKMESVGRLAGGVAHDFNNMLSVITGYSDLALEVLDPADPLTEDLREIRQAAHRSADLTRQLLTFARKQPVSPRVLDLNDTVSGILKMLRRLIGEDIELVWKPGPGVWPVEMDPTQVDQVLANLVVNARDAIEAVGTVTIETSNTVLDRAMGAAFGVMSPGRYVLLTLTDSGVGMEKEVVDHLFEPFFTTKEMGKGTGLGMAIVYGIVKQNHGFVFVYSEPGRGTTVKIYLPCVEAELSPEAPARPAQELRGSETVLLVEDEGAILRLAKSILERYGYHVLAAAGPEEALSQAEEYPGPIDLLLTDLVMPGMDGRQLRQRLAALRPGMRSLLISGYTADALADRGVGETVQFLAKPFSSRGLVEKVREVLD